MTDFVYEALNGADHAYTIPLTETRSMIEEMEKALIQIMGIPVELFQDAHGNFSSASIVSRQFELYFPKSLLRPTTAERGEEVKEGK